MKLPSIVTELFQKKKKEQKLYLSLVLESDHVVGAVFQILDDGTPEIEHAVAKRIASDSWEDRIIGADAVISALEKKLETTDFHEVIFGLPASYLSPNGSITTSVRPHLKDVATKLTLNPIGFVPIHQALLYKLKTEEGIPPSIILLEVTTRTVTLSLFKVGMLTGQSIIPNNNSVVQEIENALRSFPNAEVLPSRILLSGIDDGKLENLKKRITEHPWTIRANFLHFPRIETLPLDVSVESVSLAGASEIGGTEGFHSDNPEQEISDGTGDSPESQHPSVDTYSPENFTDDGSVEGRPDDLKEYSTGIKQPSEPQENDEVIGETSKEIKPKDTSNIGKYADDTTLTNQEDITEKSNVTFVNPEDIGFTKDTDVLSEKSELTRAQALKTRKPESTDMSVEVKGKHSTPPVYSLVLVKGKEIFLKTRSIIAGIVHKIPISRKLLLIGGIVVTVAIILFGLFYWIMREFPKAEVTLTVVPEILQAKETLEFSTGITTPDKEKKIFPAEKIETQISLDKNISVTGKKKVGDPATGSVVIYNKATSSRKLSKGTILTSDKLLFTLDADIQVASASESIGSITFGKTNAQVTASAIGTSSNLPANTEFVFKDISSSILIARNDSAFTGGTSRDVTVVTRADYDSLVKLALEDVRKNAQQELSGSMSGTMKLISNTVATTVKDKSFSNELDEEAKQLSGTVNIGITGLAYNEDALKRFIETLEMQNVPSGYRIMTDKSTATIDSVKIGKDGTVTASISYKGTAIPSFTETDLSKLIAGKRISDARTDLTKIRGIKDVSFKVTQTLRPDYLPLKSDRVVITVLLNE